MKYLLRTGLIFLLAPVLLFCAFGFLATFEPSSPAAQWAWRLIYCAAASLATLASMRLWRATSALPPRP